MRNVIIKRRKEFSASLISMKVYIEDYQASETTINGVPCRKIGELRNGEEHAFPVAEHAAKVFVVPNKMNKKFSNDFFQLPPGNQNIFLTGGNGLNPLIGYRFQFDAISGEDVIQNRKKNNKRFAAINISIIAFIVIFGFLAGFALAFFEDNYSSSAPKTFTIEGMQITLTDNFTEENYEEYTSCYDSKNVAVFTLKEDFSLFEGGGENYSIEEYADLVEKANGLSDDTLEYIKGIPCLNYDFTNPDYNITYSNLTFLYKSDNAFWIVQFTSEKNKFDEYSAQMAEWAESVIFLTSNQQA